MLIWVHLTAETPNGARMQRQEQWRGTVPWPWWGVSAMHPGDEVNVGTFRPTIVRREFTWRERTGELEAVTLHLRLTLVHGQWGTLHRAVRLARWKLAEPVLTWDSQPPTRTRATKRR